MAYVRFDEFIFSSLQRGNEREVVKSVDSIVEVIVADKTPAAAFDKLAHPDVK